MKKLALAVAVLALGMAACESDRDDDGIPDENEVAVNEQADNCPTSDGSPCR